jgi:glycerol transport system ATP-binding protein
MATIELKDLNHSYSSGQDSDSGFSITDLNVRWEDGTANALLGPSGCGKTTILNIISGLLQPSSGSVLFNGEEITRQSPRERHIAQVFQFPVVYDTMKVFDNLAFPLRNSGLLEKNIKPRVERIAELLNLTHLVDRSAGKLNPMEKQLISLGRGIIREDTSAVLLDEPLTVIDPLMKLDIRRKLREVQKELGITMIYVTHDQHEALTFADYVTVMNEGAVVQMGRPDELFLNPTTPFVGFFIGIPGMNLMDCEVINDRASVGDISFQISKEIVQKIKGQNGKIQLGIRPEFVKIRKHPGENWHTFELKIKENVGAYQILTLETNGLRIKARVDDLFDGQEKDLLHVFFPEDKIRLYYNGRLLS